MCIRINAWMEYSVLKHNFRYVTIRIIIGYDNLKSIKENVCS